MPIEIVSILKLPWSLISGMVSGTYGFIRRRTVLRAAGVPRIAITVAPYPHTNPHWRTEPPSRGGRTTVKCDWFITNITEHPLGIVATRLKPMKLVGHADLLNGREDWNVPPTIAPHSTVAVTTTFSLPDAVGEKGKSWVGDVEIVDQYGNAYTQRGIQFEYQWLTVSGSDVTGKQWTETI